MHHISAIELVKQDYDGPTAVFIKLRQAAAERSFSDLGFDILCFYMAFQPVPVHRRSLRKQIANVLEHPFDVVRTLWNKDGCAEREPPTMEAYTEAANKCIDSATTFLDHARLFVEAKRAYELWQKEIDLGRVRKEISALKLVISLLEEPASRPGPGMKSRE